MKLRYLSFLTASLCLLFAGCAQDEPVFEDNYINVSVSAIEAGWETKIVEVEVDANCSWTLSKTDEEGEPASWIKADRLSGKGSGTFSIKILANGSENPRYGSVNLSGENVSAFIDVAQEGNPDAGKEPDPGPGTDPTAEGYVMPVRQMFETAGGIDVPSGKIVYSECAFTNAVVDGNTVTFSDGLVIEKTGSAGNIQMVCPSHTNPKKKAGFQIGISADFLPGESWIYKIPMKEGLSGDLRFSYGSRKEGFASGDAAPYSWSSDEGATWNPVTKMEPAKSDAAFKSVWFTITEDKKVEAGKCLWIKVDQNAALVFVQNGITLDYASAPLSSLPEQNGSDVIISEGFDETVAVNASMAEVPGFMKTMTTGYVASKDKDTGLYSPANSSISVSHCFARPGFLQVGYSDEALVARSGWNGSVSVDVGGRLKEMGIEKTSVTMSFKASGLTNAYGVAGDAKIVVKSGETVVARIDDLSIDSFSEYSFTIKGVDQNTVLVITSEEIADKPKDGATEWNWAAVAACDLADYRFFIDDLLIKAVGGQEDPGPSTVKLSFDFSGPALEGWPVADKYGHVDGGITCTYRLDGVDYDFILADCNGASSARTYWHSKGYVIFASYYRYLGLPALEGYRLAEVECVHATSTKAGRMAGVAEGIVGQKDEVPYVEGGTPVEFAEQGAVYRFDLSGTSAGKVYYLYCSALGLGVSKIDLTYSK